MKPENFKTEKNMNKMTSENITKMIIAMSVEELKERLAAYMQAFECEVIDGELKFGFIDTNGDVIIPCIWTEADNFSDGHARVKDEDGNWYTIDKSGNVISTDDGNEDSE